jgi:hypothetical protein
MRRVLRWVAVTTVLVLVALCGLIVFLWYQAFSVPSVLGSTCNATDRPLTVWRGQLQLMHLEPGVCRLQTYQLRGPTTQIEARNENGGVVFCRALRDTELVRIQIVEGVMECAP